MKKIIFIFCLGCVIVMMNSACSLKWSEAIKYGEPGFAHFNDSVNIEINAGVIFVPVQLNGKWYRFLFDTGAPFSISEELQGTFQFPIISKGRIVDSDHNKMKVNYVQVDTIFMGEIPFINQTAFVGNFTKNPILKCLEIDGIIGSNLMRHCNWTIDQDGGRISFSKGMSEANLNGWTTVPFQSDHQFNIRINIGIGESNIRNLLVDYGSNGPIALPEEAFNKLKQKEFFDKIFIETGTQQAGIVGELIEIRKEKTFVDSIKINEATVYDVEMITGNSGLFGNRILSEFIVKIDWDRKNLYLKKSSNSSNDNKSYGFKLGYAPERGVYVRSVTENSSAFKNGIRPDRQVLKLDTLDFEGEDDYCDYIQLMDNPPNEIFIELIDSRGLRQSFHIKRALLK